MIEYHPPRLTDRAWAEPLFYAAGNLGCENNFTNLYVWRNTFRQQVARFHDFVLIRYDMPAGVQQLYPSGVGDVRPAIDALIADARERNEHLWLIDVTNEQAAQLELWYPGKFHFRSERNSWDYIYEIDRLADLGGKKLQSKRNHINRFVQNNPDWQAVALTQDNVACCMAVEKLWQQEKELDGQHISEDSVVWDALHDFDALGLEGLMIVVDGKPVAFTLGKRMTETTYDIHFEKADSAVQGAYPIVNREFARMIRARYRQIRYLNREDDVGLPGLRKSKESYVPDLLLEKNSAFWVAQDGSL
ncbi:MAG: phosphatidylglycerol lysyltransferase domain-containing protein [Oscillospiraceae bacterium]|nr:phosphatidylglycerol lysyltransferase domain-containing protein [Oscillospiraceae bacterium]